MMECHLSDHGFQLLSDDELIECLREESVEEEEDINLEIEVDEGPSDKESASLEKDQPK